MSLWPLCTYSNFQSTMNCMSFKAVFLDLKICSTASKIANLKLA